MMSDVGFAESSNILPILNYLATLNKSDIIHPKSAIKILCSRSNNY